MLLSSWSRSFAPPSGLYCPSWVGGDSKISAKALPLPLVVGFFGAVYSYQNAQYMVLVSTDSIDGSILRPDKNKEPTSEFEPLTCSLRVSVLGLQSVAQDRESHISKRFSVLSIARYCRVLRSGKGQISATPKRAVLVSLRFRVDLSSTYPSRSPPESTETAGATRLRGPYPLIAKLLVVKHKQESLGFS